MFFGHLHLLSYWSNRTTRLIYWKYDTDAAGSHIGSEGCNPSGLAIQLDRSWYTAFDLDHVTRYV